MSNEVVKVVMSLVLVIIFASVLPSIFTSLVSAASTTGISTSAASMTEILQLVAVVGGMGLALSVGYSGARGVMKKK